MQQGKEKLQLTMEMKIASTKLIKTWIRGEMIGHLRDESRSKILEVQDFKSRAGFREPREPRPGSTLSATGL
jgi:hypothetical protein